MLQGNVTIIGVGPVECGLCPAKVGEDGNPVKRDGAAVELDGSEMHFCWKHVRAFAHMKANAKPKHDPDAPDLSPLPTTHVFPTMAGNGQD